MSDTPTTAPTADTAPAESVTKTTISKPGQPTVSVETKLNPESITAREIAIIQALGGMLAFTLLKGILALVVLFGGFILFEARDSLVAAVVKSVERHIEAQHDDALHTAVEQHNVLDGMMSSIRSSLGASRAMVYQFHNGQNSLKGVPFLFLSETAEVVGPGVSDEISNHQRIPIVHVMEWLPKFLVGECIQQNIKKASGELSSGMKKSGTQVLIACPFTVDDAREPAGFVSIAYVGSARPAAYAVAQGRLKEAADIVGKTLSKAVISNK